jgi:hypothetical protein
VEEPGQVSRAGHCGARLIMSLMAGREAEIIAFGRHAGGDRNDLYWIACYAEDQNIPVKYLRRLRPRVRALLRRHWPKVERIAQALLASQKLSAAQIDALFGETILQQDRERAAKIAAARKPYRDQWEWLNRR